MKPNIFDISTKELSQDAFITWLLQWADNSNIAYDAQLHECGKAFLKELMKKEIPNFEEEIITVEAGRQWENIDVGAEVNKKYLIIIEDKTYTGQHSNQLTRYKEIAEKWCQEQTPPYYSPICIYLKTGNESENNLKKVVADGFKVFNRQEFVSLLQKYEIKNDIYNDFKSRLARIEQENHEWENKLIQEWDSNDWQGFFQYLEKKIGLIGWSYVNNPNGGFWNAALNWDYWENTYPLYIQTEQNKLCFKVVTDPDEVEMPENVSRGHIRNKASNLILNAAKEKGLTSIRRPDRFGNGKYMTVAVVDSENWLGNNEETIKKEEVAKCLSDYRTFLLEIIN
jgi:PD-(D/E)XK nuclease superfamily